MDSARRGTTRIPLTGSARRLLLGSAPPLPRVRRHEGILVRTFLHLDNTHVGQRCIGMRGLGCIRVQRIHNIYIIFPVEGCFWPKAASSSSCDPVSPRLAGVLPAASPPPTSWPEAVVSLLRTLPSPFSIRCVSFVGVCHCSEAGETWPEAVGSISGGSFVGTP